MRSKGDMKAVIMAGGKGTRLAGLNHDIPKPMFELHGKPVLEYIIKELAAQNIKDIILVIGHLGHIIKEYCGNGDKWNVKIEYIVETEPLGTAGALYFLRGKIKEDFFLLNGDIIFSIDFQKMMDFHCSKEGDATLLAHPNNHPYDSGLVQYDLNHQVTRWLTKEDERHWYKNRVNAGIHILSPRIFSFFTKLNKVDLDRDVLKELIPAGKLYAYYSTEYVKDMGTPARYEEAKADIVSGLVQAKNLLNKQKAVFFDRDGTINRHNGYIVKPDQLELLPGAAEAIKRINHSGMLAIVVTNQPVIARGDCSLAELQEIHDALETKLGEQGAYVDAIYFCPHHPDKGFAGERPEYKIKCKCRKPEPGLLLQAARDYHIDLSQSYMIGDGQSDVEAGVRAGCLQCIKVAENGEYFDLLKAVQGIIAVGKAMYNLG